MLGLPPLWLLTQSPSENLRAIQISNVWMEKVPYLDELLKWKRSDFIS